LDVSVAHWERVVQKELGWDGARKPSSRAPSLSRNRARPSRCLRP
jgi:hypothetical protein